VNLLPLPHLSYSKPKTKKALTQELYRFRLFDPSHDLNCLGAESCLPFYFSTHSSIILRNRALILELITKLRHCAPAKLYYLMSEFDESFYKLSFPHIVNYLPRCHAAVCSLVRLYPVSGIPSGFEKSLCKNSAAVIPENTVDSSGPKYPARRIIPLLTRAAIYNWQFGICIYSRIL